MRRKDASANEDAWTKDEKRKIARLSLDLMHENQAITRLDAVRQAVENGLPKARRRPVRDMYSVRWIQPIWEEIAEKLDAQHDDADLKVSPKNVEPSTPEPQADPIPETNIASPTVEPESIVAPATIEGVDIDGPKKRKVGRPGTKAPFLGELEPEQAELLKEPKGGKPKHVRWNPQERRTLALAYLKVREDFPDMRETEALRKAMAYSLPDDRQRTINGYSMEKDWLDKLVVELRAEHEREQLERKAREQEAYEAEQRQIEAERAEREAKERAEFEAALARARDMEQAATEAIEAQTLADVLALASDRQADIIADKVMAKLMGPLAELLKKAGIAADANPFAHFKQPAIEAIPEAERAQPAPRDHKPRVLICGLLNQQKNDVEREFEKLLDLSFHKGTHEGGSPLEPKLKNADLVVTMVDFSGHSREDTFRKAGVKPLRVNGNVSALKRELRKWLLGAPVRLAAA